MGAQDLKTLETLGNEALDTIKESEPPLWLAPPPELSRDARTASKYLFSLILPHAPKCPLPNLLTDNFDAEQIWQQIDLQVQPLLSSLKSRLRNLNKFSEDLRLLNGEDETKRQLSEEEMEVDGDDLDMEGHGVDIESDEEPSQSEEIQEEEGEEASGVEDRFLKINDLEKFLEEAEQQGTGPLNDKVEDDADEEEEEEEEEVGFEDEDMDGEEIGDDFGKGAQHEKSAKHPRYEDFFGGKKKTNIKKISASHSESDDMESGDDAINDDEHNAEQPKAKSSHERKMEKIRTKIEELEKANLETKTWTMQGEVTAAKRPKNSALEVELEFDHTMRPAPVITEEVTATLEDIIKRRISEEQFDDVQRKPALPSTAPKERIEMDENKSEKGLAEVYEAEYMQRTGLAAAPTSSSDALKNQAALVFKKLCVKLDALSHFQFTPKPVIEDMSVHANVPALAMEEVAPLAVSEASMLAPEELFSGEGAVKEEAELTREDRKRLRAKRKRKLRAVKANKEIDKKLQMQYKGNGEGQGYRENKPRDQKRAQTHYGKSSKVFAALDLAKDKSGSKSSQKKTDVPHPLLLKL